MHPDGSPDPEGEPARFGLRLENACLAFAINQGRRVTYWREAPLEVDAVFEGSWGDWAIEIKTGGFDLYDLKGLLELCRRNTKFRPLIITAPGDEPLASRHGLLKNVFLETYRVKRHFCRRRSLQSGFYKRLFSVHRVLRPSHNPVHWGQSITLYWAHSPINSA